MPNSAHTWVTAMPNEISITAQAIPPDRDLDSRRPNVALSRNPANGSSAIAVSTSSPFERGEGLGIERLPVAEQADDQRQADGGLGGGHGHDEEGDDLAVDVALLPPEGDEREVDGVEHDLHRQQQRDQVAAQEHPCRADGEEQARQRQVVANRHVHSSRFRASTTAPTMATMIRMEVTSNASVYLLNSTWPSVATEGTAGRASPTPAPSPAVRDSAQPSSSASSIASTAPMRVAAGR